MQEQSPFGHEKVHVPPPQSVLQPPPGHETSHVAPAVQVVVQSPAAQLTEHFEFAPHEVVQLPAVQVKSQLLPAAQSAVHALPFSGQSSEHVWPAPHAQLLPLQPFVPGGVGGGGAPDEPDEASAPASPFPIEKSYVHAVAATARQTTTTSRSTRRGYSKEALDVRRCER